MKAVNHKDYEPEFPERFNWALVDSHKLSELAIELAAQIRTACQLRLEYRNNVPGLRFALNRIAERAEV